MGGLRMRDGRMGMGGPFFTGAAIVICMLIGSAKTHESVCSRDCVVSTMHDSRQLQLAVLRTHYANPSPRRLLHLEDNQREDTVVRNLDDAVNVDDEEADKRHTAVGPDDGVLGEQMGNTSSGNSTSTTCCPCPAAAGNATGNATGNASNTTEALTEIAFDLGESALDFDEDT